MFHVERIHRLADRDCDANACDNQPMEIEVIARLLIICNHHILICHSIEGGYGYLPGGHIEFDESAAEAARRELLEEAGLRCKVGDLALTSEVRFKTKKQVHHEINLIFHATLEATMFHVEHGAPPPVPSLEDHLAFLWVPLRELTQYDLRPMSHINPVIAIASEKPTPRLLSDWPEPK